VNCFIICCIIIDCMSCFFAPKIFPPTVASATPNPTHIHAGTSDPDDFFATGGGGGA